MLLFGFDDLEPAAQGSAYKVSRDEHCFETLHRQRALPLGAPAQQGCGRGRCPAGQARRLADRHHHRTPPGAGGHVGEIRVRRTPPGGRRQAAGRRTGAAMDRQVALQALVHLRPRLLARAHHHHSAYDFYRRAPGLLAAVRDAAAAKGYRGGRCGPDHRAGLLRGLRLLESDLYFNPSDEARCADGRCLRTAFKRSSTRVLRRPSPGEVAEAHLRPASDEGYLNTQAL